MAVTKKIEIDGREVTFKASAAVPRLYRIKFGRDIYKDLRQLEKSVGENDERTMRTIPTSTCSVWKCSRTWHG